jgi:hypothetical protein
MKRPLFILLCSLIWVVPLMSQSPQTRLCEADFTWEQDPANYLIVNFTNISVGNYTQYLWNFGDGSTFEGENPSHAFPYEGDFTVCLQVSNNDTVNPCNDTYCVEIPVTPDPIYELGGLLFAGMYPINNPVNTGDHAFAYLYRLEDNGCKPVDTVMFDTLGYFWFANVREGSYLLKAGLKENSVRFHDFLPAYHGNVLRWVDSDTLIVDHDIFNASIYMVSAETMATGEGRITGHLMMDQSHGGITPVGGGQVVLADMDGNPYSCDMADAEGNFAFDNLPEGDYMIFGEYTGSDAQLMNVTLDSAQMTADSLTLMVYSEIPGVDDDQNTIPSVTIYPNPVDDQLQVHMNLLINEQVEVILLDYLGRECVRHTWRMPPGSFRQTIDVQSLSPNLYLAVFRGMNHQWQVVKKFLKK